MIPYDGHSKHTVTLKRKPIPMGFKVWVLAYEGYINDWLYRSAAEGPEATVEKLVVTTPGYTKHHVTLAPTFQVVYQLMKGLRDRHPQQHYVVFLDNLFTTLELVHALLLLGVAAMGTSRKNVIGFPAFMIKLKA